MSIHLSGASVFNRASSINSVGIVLIPICPGSFFMGSSENEVGRHNSESLHRVTIRETFFISKYPITQLQYRAVMGQATEHPQVVSDKSESDLPITGVTWFESVEFCQRLSQLRAEERNGRVYSLPSESQWEYACRAGTRSAYSFGKHLFDLGDYAWYANNSGRQVQRVGLKSPNPWGVCDMHGNVWEWCSSHIESYMEKGEQAVSAGDSTSRIVRGGSCLSPPIRCRSAQRSWEYAWRKGRDIGFRVVLTQPSGVGFRGILNRLKNGTNGDTVARTE